MPRHPSRIAHVGLAVLRAASTASCVQMRPDELDSRRVPVPVNEPVELTVEYGASGVFADVDHAAEVRCEAWPVGEPAQRAELRPHYLDIQTPVPVTRDGVKYHTVGKIPSESGRVVVECRGPAGADLYAVLTEPPV